jgi:hypothetical protein
VTRDAGRARIALALEKIIQVVLVQSSESDRHKWQPIEQMRFVFTGAVPAGKDSAIPSVIRVTNTAPPHTRQQPQRGEAE